MIANNITHCYIEYTHPANERKEFSFKHLKAYTSGGNLVNPIK